MESSPQLSHPEHEIFHDPTGKRWKIARVLAFILAAGLAFLLFYFTPRILAPAKVIPYQVSSPGNISAPKEISTPAPEALASELATFNVPVIGTGPLVRIDHITQVDNQTVAIEAYSNKVTKVLNPAETAAVSNYKYAIERYGSGKSKKIALTFDDGPDAVYSPQILDVLAKQDMPSTFFLVGSNVVKNASIAERMAREGHTVGNHTFDHVNFDLQTPFQSEQQINQTDRVITAATHRSPTFFRPPYGGPNDQAMRDTLRGLLYSQELGYVNASYTFDSKDYEKHKDLPPLPDFDGTDIVMLLHDGGGKRDRTIAYLNKLGPAARAHGYTFANLSELYPQDPPFSTPVEPSIVDKAAFAAFSAYLVWPHAVIGKLFFVSAFAIVFSMFINVILAALQMRRAKYGKRPRGFNPLVSVLVPAYNEEVVLLKTVRSLLQSSYRNIEIIIIDDGSKDNTWKEAQKIAKKFKRVRSFTQPNGGKSKALNFGISKANGEILICIDADTVFPPDVIGKMVRHFVDPTVGAVAGSVKVGNITNMITRWQALEYTVGIHLERTAQAFLGAIVVVPGACGAWRKEAIVAAGGFSKSTLAEDCDLTLAIQKSGYRVVQDNTAKGYTEVPQSYRALSKQRFRWIFGNLQAFWKHRGLMFRRRYGWLGMFVIPYAAFNILLPFIFIPVLLSLMIENIMSGQYLTILLFAGLTLMIQFVVAFAGVALARERYRLLLAFPMTRLMYSPLKTYILFRTALTALKGAQVGWNKLQRTGNVHYPKMPRLDPETANPVEA
jgi:cellulose synthase/poly-beta-1,6-N-acetylglucosamine synthase-like glycosyltransferase/peptidoglycan/xylan/chitin deacetylase (PgdA/CDA1 family)